MEGYDEHFSFEELTDSEDHPELVEENREYAKKYLNYLVQLEKFLGINQKKLIVDADVLS